jgi:hypothetical protein
MSNPGAPIDPRTKPRLPSLAQLRTETFKKTGQRACLFQLKFAQAILKGDKDVLLEVRCGLGKTLAFQWIPLFWKPDGIQIVVTALNCQDSDPAR